MVSFQDCRHYEAAYHASSRLTDFGLERRETDHSSRTAFGSQGNTYPLENFSDPSAHFGQWSVQHSSAGNLHHGSLSANPYAIMPHVPFNETQQINPNILNPVRLQQNHSQFASADTAEREGFSNSSNQQKAPLGRHRTQVVHDYHDHYRDPGNFERPAAAGKYPSKEVGSGRPSFRGGTSIHFPERLFEMLDREDELELAHIVSWQPHGRSFLVHRTADFVATVLPRFFRQSKFTSFQRQLNLYGFTRLSVGRDSGSYYHELFLRGCPKLCRRIIRRRIKGNGVKPAPSPRTEPDFYNMEWCDQNGPKKQADSDEDETSLPIAAALAPLLDEGYENLRHQALRQQQNDQSQQQASFSRQQEADSFLYNRSGQSGLRLSSGRMPNFHHQFVSESSFQPVCRSLSRDQKNEHPLTRDCFVPHAVLASRISFRPPKRAKVRGVGNPEVFGSITDLFSSDDDECNVRDSNLHPDKRF